MEVKRYRKNKKFYHMLNITIKYSYHVVNITRRSQYLDIIVTYHFLCVSIERKKSTTSRCKKFSTKYIQQLDVYSIQRVDVEKEYNN